MMVNNLPDIGGFPITLTVLDEVDQRDDVFLGRGILKGLP